MTDIADWGPSAGVQAEMRHAPSRPRLSMPDLLVQLWRTKVLMVAVAVVIFLLGLVIAFQMPEQYESRSGLYVTSGDEVRSTTLLSDPSFDQRPGIQEVIQGELEILRTQLVAERTLSQFPLSDVYPTLAAARDRAIARNPGDQDAIEVDYFQQGVERFRKAFWASASPNSNIVAVGFRHKNLDTAAELLNATMKTYLERRAELFGSRPVVQLRAERKRAETDLVAAETDIRTFLTEHAIRDFASERSTAQALYAAISNELYTVSARISAVNGQLARTRTQLASTPAQQDIYVEDSSAERLRELQIERNQALVSYTPESRRVQAIDRQINELRAFLDTQDGLVGTVRRGPNPTYQTLQTSLNSLEADAQSLAEQRTELQRQLQAVEDKLDRFSQLEGEWNELLRNRDLIETGIRTIAEREQREGAVAGMTAQDTDSVKITEPATQPIKGQSLRLPVAILALFFAVFSALMIGLFKAVSRPGFVSASSLERTVGIRVLGAVGKA